jgi:glycosyltransferase involved in cell wall biosynthesis
LDIGYYLVIGAWLLEIDLNICILTSSFPSHPDDHLQAPFLIDFIHELRRRGHRVFIFTQDRIGEKKEFIEEVKVKWFHWMGSHKPLIQINPFSPLDLVRIISLFWRGKEAVVPFVKENKIAACLALWVLPAGYFSNYVYRKTRIPYSVWALGSDIYRYGQNPFLYPFMKRVVQEARGVFADGFNLAQKVEEQFKRKCDFLATARAFTLPLNKPNEPNEPDKLNKPNKPYQFLFVGRLEKVKGIDLLLQALALLKVEHFNFHLTVVGKGSMEEWAENFSRLKGLKDRITFTGALSDSSLASLYQSSDCVVIPSRSESIPLVFSEALNFNRELIVTDVGDMGELGRQYGVADVVPPENPVALKEAIKKKLQSQKGSVNKEKREELLKLFDIETSVDRFLKDYV